MSMPFQVFLRLIGEMIPRIESFVAGSPGTVSADLTRLVSEGYPLEFTVHGNKCHIAIGDHEWEWPIEYRPPEGHPGLN
jgi:hypothetical protein